MAEAVEENKARYCLVVGVLLLLFFCWACWVVSWVCRALVPLPLQCLA